MKYFICNIQNINLQIDLINYKAVYIFIFLSSAERFSEIVQDCKPKVCLELGTYCGYSAILLGSMLPDDGKIYTVEFDKDFVRAAQELVEYAGMQEKVRKTYET